MPTYSATLLLCLTFSYTLRITFLAATRGLLEPWTLDDSSSPIRSIRSIPFTLASGQQDRLPAAGAAPSPPVPLLGQEG